MNKTCAHCDQPAEKRRNEGHYCLLHYRIKQMRDDAAVDRKLIPSRTELEELFNGLLLSGMRCSICGQTMAMLKTPRRMKSTVTLQHDRSGAFRLICLSCNVKHQFMPGDEFYQRPDGHKRCTQCGEVKPHEQFYRRPAQPDGLRSECKKCSSRLAVIGIRERRQRARAMQ